MCICEMIGGSQREDNYDTLIENMELKKVEKENVFLFRLT